MMAVVVVTPRPTAACPAGTYRTQVAADDPRPGCVNGDLKLVIDRTTITRSRIIDGQPSAGQPFTYSVFRDEVNDP